MSKSEKGVSRRDLLTFWRRPLAALAEPQAASMPRILRPPGAVDEPLFSDLCIRCGECVAICPAQAIVPLGASAGAAAGTPAIDARRQPCVLCVDLQCTRVCPSGALRPVLANQEVAMGTALLDQATCLSYRGQACDVCHTACPTGAIAIGADGRVEVQATACVGCGLCEHVCPTAPAAIRVVPRS